MKKRVSSLTRKTVGLTLPHEITIGLSKARFVVQEGCIKVGELQVSQGSIVWFPRFGKLGYKMDWDGFKDCMENNGRKCRRR
jgi:hypothetical protein